MRWLEAVRDVILVYAEIKPYDVVLDIGTGTGLLAFKALEQQNCSGRVIFSDMFQDCLDGIHAALYYCGIIHSLVYFVAIIPFQAEDY